MRIDDRQCHLLTDDCRGVRLNPGIPVFFTSHNQNHLTAGQNPAKFAPSLNLKLELKELFKS